MVCKKLKAFTIIELLVVIVVIGVLASITAVSYSGVQERARVGKMRTDLETLSKAIQIAREISQKTLVQLTGSGYTAGSCVTKPVGTDLATLDKATDSCWLAYFNALNVISNSSGVNVKNMVDPWGRPYFIDQNEGENVGDCRLDIIDAYALPFNGSSRYSVVEYIPLSGYSGCAS